MKRKYTFMFFGFIIICIISCRKDKTSENTSVKITLFDENVQKFRANEIVYIEESYEKKNFDILTKGITTTQVNGIIKQGITDINGRYDFGVIETKDNQKYTYFANGKEVNKGAINNVFCLSQGYTDSLIVNFFPPPPYNIGDSLVVNFIAASQPLKYSFKITDMNYSIYSKIGNKLASIYYINIDKFKSGVYTNIRDTVLYDIGTKNHYNLSW